MENGQNHFEGWAIVELFGHQKIAGYVKTEAFGTAAMFRVDVPPLPERERVLERPTYVNGAGYCGAGTKIGEPPIEGFTRLLGVGAIYAINPCSELTVMRMVEELSGGRNIKVLELVADKPQLTSGIDEQEDDDDSPV